MKAPCPQCAASSVWVGFAKVTIDGGEIVIRYRCGLCEHEWPVDTPRANVPKASLRPKRRRRAS